MKKILLLAAIAFSANVMAQDVLTDITPAAYDWANQPVGTKMVIKHAVGGWQTDVQFAYDLIDSKYLENGGCISANTGAAAIDPSVLMNGTAVVDLGAGIGKVMCINGTNSKAQEVLGFTTDASINKEMQLNFFTDPNKTPRSQWIRLRLVLNIFSNEISSTDVIIKNMYFMDADNNNKTSDLTNFPENSITSEQFILLDEEGDPLPDDNGDYVYDKSRWLTFEVDYYVMDKFLKDSNPIKGLPLKWKMYMPGMAKANSTIFIKELKFFTLEGYNDDKDLTKVPAYANKPHLTNTYFTVEDTGIRSLGSTKTQEGIYNLAGQRINNAQLKRGIYLVNGKKVVK